LAPNGRIKGLRKARLDPNVRNSEGGISPR
jgi:hypothetical protein